MARSANQKLKLLYLMRYLLRNSDENHPFTVRQMGEYLRGQGISAERKSLYDDIEALRAMAAHVGRDKVENVNEVAPAEQPSGGLMSRLRSIFG